MIQFFTNHAYRKHTQQRCLPSILQSNHRYVHLRRPIEGCVIRDGSYQGQCRHCPANATIAQAVTADYHAGVLGLQYIPEQPQQPVIDAPEKAGHAMRRIQQ